jgi:hypothetical protein
VWFRTGACLAWAGAVPLGAFAVFCLNALRQQDFQWHPGVGEAVVVALIWIGSLALPVCGFRLWRAASQPQDDLALPAMLAVGSILLGIMVAIPLTNRPRTLPLQPQALVPENPHPSSPTRAPASYRFGRINHPPKLPLQFQILAPGNLQSNVPTQVPVSYRFGPVIERVIQARETGSNCFLNLATAELLTPPPAIAELLDNNDLHWLAYVMEGETRPFQYVIWWRQSGADLMLHNRQKILGLDGFFCLAHGPTLENWDSWDFITPEQTVYVGEFSAWLRRYPVDKKAIAPKHVDGAPQHMRGAEQYSQGKLGDPVVSVLTREQSVTYYFRTREGVSGLLQIAGFTDTPRGVKIRYKLVQKVPGSAVMASPEIPRQLEAGSETNGNKP